MDTFTEHFFPAADKMPEKMIVKTDDLLRDFFQDLGDVSVSQRDLEEVLTEIICELLNYDQSAQERIESLPDCNRMIDSLPFIMNPRAVPKLADALKKRLIELGAFRNEEFPYFFDRLFGRDIVLCYLPF